MACDISALTRCAAKLAQAAREGAIDSLTGEVGGQLLEAAQERTPVDTGKLSAGWQMEQGPLSAVVSNPVAYASYVERGHRTKSGGWVPGRLMLEGAVAATEARLPMIALEAIQKVLGRCLR